MRKLLFLLLFLPFLASAQTVCSLESRERLDGFLEKLSQTGPTKQDINDLVDEVGSWFLQTPYVEKTLELPGDEQLVINLMGLDCTTYLETVVTLARLGKMGIYSFEEYEKQLAFLRYIDGQQGEYPTRLHYFSDWIVDNAEKGLLKDVTAEIGGVLYVNQPSFMSSNPKFYAQLSNPAYVDELKKREKIIGARTYHYIPKEKIASLEQGIQAGDLIAITASMANLDVVHVGFAVKKNGRIHLMHASSVSKMVEISEKPLADYLAPNKSQSGIIVARLIGK
jgi:hypothetical protein